MSTSENVPGMSRSVDASDARQANNTTYATNIKQLGAEAWVVSLSEKWSTEDGSLSYAAEREGGQVLVTESGDAQGAAGLPALASSRGQYITPIEDVKLESTRARGMPQVRTSAADPRPNVRNGTPWQGVDRCRRRC